MQQPYSFRFHEHRALFASLGVLVLITVMVLSEVLFKGILTGFYIGLAVAVVFATFLCLLRPRAILCAVLIYLASPVPILWSPSYSGAITGILLVNCIAGVLLTEGVEAFRPLKTRATFWLIVAMIAALAYAVLRGNRPGYLLGDFYQLFEFASIFVLTRVLIRSEEQWRGMVNVLLGIIVATSLMQLADAVQGADYLPHLNQFGVDLPRTINLNAPVAFCAIFSLLSVDRRRWKSLAACLAILSVNLIFGFTRGLWLATVVSVVFLLLVQHRRARRKAIKYLTSLAVVFIVVGSILTLGSNNFLKIIEDRVAYSFTQYESASGGEEVLSARRFIEWALIGAQIVEHPIAGKGLGATYEIAGEAVLEGPKDEQIDFHYIHNLYLLIAFRLGIPALLLFLFVLWKYFRRSINNYRTTPFFPENAALLAGLISAMFGELVLSMTSPTLLNHPTGGVLGCIMALTYFRPETPGDLPPRALRTQR